MINPEYSKDWKIRKNKKIRYLTCDLLTNHSFEHFFFTRSNIKTAPEELINLVSQSKPLIYKSNQVHGNNVIESNKIESTANIKADGLISNGPNECLCIFTADCVPILYADKKDGTVAVSHAGWKGLTKMIIKKTIHKLLLKGTKLENIIIAIGPCISAKNYPVGLNVINPIAKSLYIKGFKLPILNKNIIESFNKLKIISKTCEEDRFKLDLRLVAYYQLIQEGIKASNISVCKYCTFDEKELFYSWRREECKERQYSSIISKLC